LGGVVERRPRFSFEYLTGETFTPTRLVELGVSQPPLFAPGTAWSYSNTNTVLLGMVIQIPFTGPELAAEAMEAERRRGKCL
jgi:CubicO group peptidase (beta-lactamase class C family)